jgi:hypothetical protein
MDFRLSWMYVRISGLKVKKRGLSVIVPVVKSGTMGDYHTIVWMWFYIILGRNLYELEADLDRKRQVEYQRCA